MHLWYQLDLPQIPPELLVGLDSLAPTGRSVPDIGYDRRYEKNGRRLEACSYTNTNIVCSRLRAWLSQCVPSMPRVVYYQYQTKGAHIAHTDLVRRWALNYFITTGGSRVSTSWYQQRGHRAIRGTKQGGQQTDTGSVNYQDLELLDTVVCQPSSWYLISTSVLHDVDSVETIRSSISLSYSLDQAYQQLALPELILSQGAPIPL
jgi:hypothetical protein